MNTILNIDKLTASIEKKLIIDNFNLNIGEGETHVIMDQTVQEKVLYLKFSRGTLRMKYNQVTLISMDKIYWN